MSEVTSSDRAADIALALEQLFTNVQVIDDPSPYFYATDVFPETLYQDFLANLPDDAAYTTMEGRTTNQRALNSRLTLPFKPNSLNSLPETVRPFWTDAAQSFLHPGFPTLAITAYKSVLQAYRPDLLEPGVRVTAKWELLRDFQSYGIGPHADHPNKVLTLLFYLSDGVETEALGTSLYRPKDPSFTCDSGVHHTPDGFDRALTVTYRPNAVFGFLRTNVGFHGVEVIEQPNVTRNVMRYALWKEG